MVRILLFLGLLSLPAIVGSLIIFGMMTYIWTTETAAEAVDYLAGATAFLFLIAAVNGLIAWGAERIRKQSAREIMVGAMHNTAGVGIICLLVLIITSIAIR